MATPLRGGKHTCAQCFKSFNSAYILLKHEKICKNTHLRFKCEHCPRIFSRKDALKRHTQIYHQREKFTCANCSIQFLYRRNLNAHIRNCNRSQNLAKRSRLNGDASIPNESSIAIENYRCNHCISNFASVGELLSHYTEQHTLNNNMVGGGMLDMEDNCNVEESLGGDAIEFNFKARAGEGEDPIEYFAKYQDRVVKIVNAEQEKRLSIKWFACITLSFSKMQEEGLRDYHTVYFRSETKICTESADILEQYREMVHRMMKRIEEYEGENSGLIFEGITHLKLGVVKFQPVAPSRHIPLPDRILKKRAVLNIKNNDNLCFLYAILAKLHHVPEYDHANRAAHYTPYLDELNVRGFTFPMHLNRISKFEEVNNLAINVFALDDGINLYPVHISDMLVDDSREIDLLLVQNDETSHYCLIRSLSRLLKRGHQHKGYVCKKCLWRFISEDGLLIHKPYCYDKAQRVIMPDENNYYKEFGLGDFNKMYYLPFVLYCDFECLLPTSPEDSIVNGCDSVHSHEPCGYSIQMHSTIPAISKPLILYRGDDACERFMSDILQIHDDLMPLFNNPKDMILTAGDLDRHNEATECYLCGRELGGDKVLDHCHLSGRVRGSCHNACNLNFKLTKRIPVVFHNLQNYYGHIIFNAAATFKDRKISCIPKTDEHFLTFSIDNLHFIDSLRFLSASLQSLADNLATKGEQEFVKLRDHFGDNASMLTRKLPYPYEYFDDMSRFDERNLPPKDRFYSSLSEEHTVYRIENTNSRKNFGAYSIFKRWGNFMTCI